MMCVVRQGRTRSRRISARQCMGGIFSEGMLWQTLSDVRPVRLRRKASISGGPAVTSVISSFRSACKGGAHVIA